MRTGLAVNNRGLLRAALTVLPAPSLVLPSSPLLIGVDSMLKHQQLNLLGILPLTVNDYAEVLIESK